MERDRRSPPPLTRAAALQLLTLWSFAVAQPLYDVLRRNREFFVAHRTEVLDVVLLAVAISIAAPAVLAALAALAGAISRRAGRVVFLLIAGTLAAAVALQALYRAAPIAAEWQLAIAAMAGGATAWACTSTAPARLFLLLLSPAVLVFPAVLLLHPDMAPFVRPSAGGGGPAPPPGREPVPIVMVVFDQLPLTSLMTETGDIDRENFPGFAELGASSTWYRDATAVGDNTGFALPPIVTGMRPNPRRLPVAQDHPDNLFTWLAGTYRFEVQEAITGLCPASSCPQQKPAAGARLAAMLGDVTIVYLHIVLPEEQRAALPPLTENWRDFAAAQQWGRRWVAERDRDRRRPVRAFIDGISRQDPQPTLYFLHALLPHEPYTYLRSGRRFTPEPRLVGLRTGHLWTEHEGLVVEQYRLHLVQLGYVDRLVEDLMARLRREGLWDRALVVVTADHGASFRPGQPFKTARPATLGDIAPVPLFIKAPGQQTGAVSDRNVDAADILPTIADLLGARLPWTSDGVSALDAPARRMKLFQQGSHRRPLRVLDADLAMKRTASAARRIRFFGRGPNPYWRPAIAPHGELIGRQVSSLAGGESVSLQVLVEDSARYRHVDPHGDVVPSQIMGRVVNEAGLPQPAALAIAVNGTIAATAQAYAGSARSSSPTWTTFIAPDAFRAGRNDLEVFIVRAAGDAVRLERGFTSTGRPDGTNLASRAAAQYWGVSQAGLHEWGGSPPLYWTEREAVLTVPVDTAARPRSLRIGLASGPAQGPLRVSIGDCVLFDAPIDAAPWYRTFSLDRCGDALDGPSARIVLRSATHREAHRDGARDVGVMVETVNLYAWEWPLARQDGPVRLAVQPMADPGTSHARGSVAEVAIANTGPVVVFGPADSPAHGLELDLQWARPGQAPRPAGQRVRLPRTLYPGERLVMPVPLMPPPGLDEAGPWDLHVVPVQADGTRVPLDRPCVLRVVPEG